MTSNSAFEDFIAKPRLGLGLIYDTRCRMHDAGDRKQNRGNTPESFSSLLVLNSG
jgi:hypothetical protein